MIVSNPLSAAVQNKGILLAAHRGMSAGNIPCNTIPAFEAALRQGADILELDLTRTGDGQLIVFHPGKEKPHLKQDIHLEQMTMEQIRPLRFVNIDDDDTPYGILTLDEFLEQFKNRCLINLDHAWDDLEQTAAIVRRHKMEDQILLKTPSKLKYIQQVEAFAPELMFMPIYKEKDELTPIIETMNVNFVGAEVVFASDDSCLASEEYIRSHHEKGRALWVNPIIYHYKAQLTGGHSDDVAITGDPEYGWGWLVDKGFDILQTDWILALREFVDNR